MKRYDPCHSRDLNCSLRYQEGILIYGASARERYFYIFCMMNIMCPGWSEANKLRAESPERKDTMSENVYTIPLMLSSNEQIGVFMDFAACIPDTIATSGKAYCKRIMTDVTRNAEKERFYCVVCFSFVSEAFM